MRKADHSSKALSTFGEGGSKQESDLVEDIHVTTTLCTGCRSRSDLPMLTRFPAFSQTDDRSVKP
jgi:hypothetical protein